VFKMSKMVNHHNILTGLYGLCIFMPEQEHTGGNSNRHKGKEGSKGLSGGASAAHPGVLHTNADRQS